MVGRFNEKEILDQCVRSGRPEFVAVYGRRRVGKTFLIKEYFGDRFSFYATGINNQNTKGQLKAFHASLREYGSTEKTIPKDWFEAFLRLKEILQNKAVKRETFSGRRLVFLDELPWMDTARSDFKSALDYFWNSWGSSQKDLMLIVCGSATSWIIKNLLADTGGFYNRVTRRIHLAPFTLRECKDLLDQNHVVMTDKQIIETYMIFGGIPFYLNMLNERFSLAQNVDALIFHEYGDLHNEYQNLFESLYKNPGRHERIISALSKSKDGLTRVELSGDPAIGDGEPLTKTLSELVECGFVRQYKNYTTPKQGCNYQLIDPFLLFSLKCRENDQISSWQSYIHTPGYYSWRGNAFEIVCLNHIREIKTALGIAGVETGVYAWRSKKAEPGVQIDLLIDRKDGIINICEMKYSDKEYVIDKKTEEDLIRKTEAFREEVHPDKALHITLISASGVKENQYRSVAQRVINGEELLKQL